MTGGWIRYSNYAPEYTGPIYIGTSKDKIVSQGTSHSWRNKQMLLQILCKQSTDAGYWDVQQLLTQ